MKLLLSFLKTNWLTLALIGAAYFFVQDYKAQIADVATLKATVTQMKQTLSELEADNKSLREDIKIRDEVNVTRKERSDALNTKTQEAERILEQGKTTTPWGDQPYPAYVYDAVRVLEQTAGNNNSH